MTFKAERGWIKQLEDQIPFSSEGDPTFTCVDDIREVFTDDQLIYIVNKYLYGQFYNREYHSQRAKTERKLLAPVKKRVRQLFGVSYIAATPEQIEAATESLREDIRRVREERERMKPGD